MAGRKIRDARDARQCLEDAAGSGLGRAAWARAHGVDARSLNAWRLNLARSDGPSAAEPSPTLCMLELVPTTPRSEVTYRVRCGAFEVEVDADFDDHVLGRLLRVVGAC